MFTIYGVPLSIHVRKVIVAALEKRLEHHVEAVFPFDPPPGWRELSPTGKIPALKHGELTLADSSVIVAYLEKRFPELPLNPSDPAQYARALWFEEYVDSQIAPDVIGLFHRRCSGPMVHKTGTGRGRRSSGCSTKTCRRSWTTWKLRCRVNIWSADASAWRTSRWPRT